MGVPVARVAPGSLVSVGWIGAGGAVWSSPDGYSAEAGQDLGQQKRVFRICDGLTYTRWTNATLAELIRLRLNGS